MADEAAQAAAGVIADLVGDDTAEATAEVVEQPAPAPEQEAPAFDLPSFDADTEGLDDLFNQPDFDEDDEPVPAAAPAQQVEETWDDDEEKQQLRRELAKLRKQAAWAEEQRVKASQNEWRKEAARRFPLADVDQINATSRRAMLRQAKEQHDRYYAKIEPVLTQIEQLREAAVAEVKTQARQEAEQAWGRPTTGPQQPVVEQGEDDVKLDRRNYRNLHDRTLALIRAGKLQI